MTIADVIKNNVAKTNSYGLFTQIKNQVSAAAMVADRQFEFFEYAHLYEYLNDFGYWDVIQVVNSILDSEYDRCKITSILSAALTGSAPLGENYLSFLAWAGREGINFKFYVYRKTPESDITVSMMFSVID